MGIPLSSGKKGEVIPVQMDLADQAVLNLWITDF
jgi:hypothetical protein